MQDNRKVSGACTPSSSKVSDEKDSIRHCSFCLNICETPVKHCSKCKKRVYCSKQCQSADWSIKGTGQRHKNWCKLHESVGEEDVDWQVSPVPKKGLGIIAKRFIPAGFKIIVEPVYSSSNYHPGINDLTPIGGSFDDKLFINHLLGMTNGDERDDFIALRIARVNHSCRPNAGHMYDETARVAILFAQRDIQPGEEILICYIPFFRMDPEMPLIAENIDLLSVVWGITCPPDCYCKDPKALALVLEGRKLYLKIRELAERGEIERALVAGEKLLDIHRRLDVSWMLKAVTDFFLFQIAVRKLELIPRAKKYIRAAVDVYKMVSPYCERTKKYEKLLKDPKLDANYMMTDKIESFYYYYGKMPRPNDNLSNPVEN